VPQLKPQFESLVEDLSGRIQDISTRLLASDVFKGMKEEPVPEEIVAAFKDSFDDLTHNVERRDATSICPKTIQSFRDIDDDLLKSGLTETLTAVQNMTRNLEKTRVR
jgi:hypothetical protein